MWCRGSENKLCPRKQIIGYDVQYELLINACMSFPEHYIKSNFLAGNDHFPASTISYIVVQWKLLFLNGI